MYLNILLYFTISRKIFEQIWALSAVYLTREVKAVFWPRNFFASSCSEWGWFTLLVRSCLLSVPSCFLWPINKPIKNQNKQGLLMFVIYLSHAIEVLLLTCPNKFENLSSEWRMFKKDCRSRKRWMCGGNESIGVLWHWHRHWHCGNKIVHQIQMKTQKQIQVKMQIGTTNHTWYFIVCGDISD